MRNGISNAIGRSFYIASILEQFVMKSLGDDKPVGVTFSQLLMIAGLCRARVSLSRQALIDEACVGTNIEYNIRCLVGDGYIIKKNDLGSSGRTLRYLPTEKAKKLSLSLLPILDYVEEGVSAFISVAACRSVEWWVNRTDHTIPHGRK